MVQDSSRDASIASALNGSNFSSAYKKYFKAEGALVKKYAQGTFLDVGCGNGRILPFMYAACEKYVGIDFDARVIETSTALFKKKFPRAKFMCGDAKKLTTYFEKDSFDVAVCLWNTLHCIGDEVSVLKEILSVTKGFVIVTFVAKGDVSWRERVAYYRKVGTQFSIDAKTQTIRSLVWGESKSYSLDDVQTLATKANSVLVASGSVSDLVIFGVFTKK